MVRTRSGPVPRFRDRYRVELLRHREDLATLAIQGEATPVTLLHAAKDSRFSNAAVLKELLEEVLEGGRPRPARKRGAATGATPVTSRSAPPS